MTKKGKIVYNMNRMKLYKNKELAKETRNRQKRRYYGKTAFIYGKREWTREEDIAIIKHEHTDSKLSEMLERSVSAIQKRRCILRKENCYADYDPRRKTSHVA